MPIDVTKKGIWQVAETLARENKVPTTMNIRSRLGGGSPHMIASHLADWKTEYMEEDEALFHTDWELQSLRRKALEQEQMELIAEIERLDADLQRSREEAIDNTEALNTERKAHQSIKSHSERWYQQLKDLQDIAEKLTTENQALKVEVAALKEQAARSEELKDQMEKLQNDLTGLVGGMGVQKNATQSVNTKSKARKKVIPEKRPEVQQKTFPPSFGVAQKVGKPKVRW
uniref:Replication region DNA-binding N-term n=1 Tax=Candidatus Kentrum sp. TUN TaxID=2126343 RepID=A0A450ZE39_9GAMM|nr:MAG: replication region DNA-binding N-term [Candidatus Kentron sp. TUN]VFK51047.1 MAG: replication region DNA-binding N-term [Candidatus Kentron sp. TUN]VFK52027.1 MAG: replication region DNA-binding N-term [Candidatus Kentron sp. TUN]